mgnify:CR=1
MSKPKMEDAWKHLHRLTVTIDRMRDIAKRISIYIDENSEKWSGFHRDQMALVDGLKCAFELVADVKAAIAGKKSKGWSSYEVEPISICMADVKPAETPGYAERAYRKGFSHALQLAYDQLSTGNWTMDDLDTANEIALEWRFDRRPHSVYMDELRNAVKRMRKGKRM